MKFKFREKVKIKPNYLNGFFDGHSGTIEFFDKRSETKQYHVDVEGMHVYIEEEFLERVS